jgi:hypothetical protein
MAVQYVSDFSFPKSPPRPSVVAGQRPTVRGYAKGGHVKASTPQPYAKGGSCSTTPFKYKSGGSVSPDVAKGVAGKSPQYAKLNDKSDPKSDTGKKSGMVKPAFKDGGSIKVATGKVADGKKTPWNADDAVSPGSPKRTPPGQGEKNSAAAKSQFSREGKGTEPATKQDGDVERMSGWSDFKKGGSVKHDRIKNLGHYAHGGKVKAEKPSGKAGSKSVKAPVAKVATPKKAEPTKAPAGSRVEMKSGTAKAAMGGLSRGVSPRKNAAIHAKESHKAPKGASGALAGLAQALSAPPHQPAAPGMGPAPPGMAPGMGSPPGQAMGPRPAPPMAGGPPMMSTGGVVHNHFWGK